MYEDIGCTISGNATLAATRTESVYSVALSAVENCGDGAQSPVGQHCVAQQTQDRVSIRCQIVRIAPDRSYLPDDFELVVRAPGVMTGLLTANWNAPAVWRRRNAAPIA